MTKKREVVIERVRGAAAQNDAAALIWGFFDHLRVRYHERQADIDTYIEYQDVAGQIATFDTFFNPPAGECLIGRLDGAPVGIVMLKRVDADLCEMNRLFVDDAARGVGMGKALVGQLLDEARAMGFTQMRLDAWDRHQEALPLYESFGFEYYSAPEILSEDMVNKPIQMRRTL